MDDAAPTESAVIVAVPEADAAVGRWRSRLDPAAGWGVPAHVTVLYSFVPPAQITPAVLEALAAAVQSVAAFDADFARVEWFGEQVVWLAPEPEVPFRALTATVCAAFPSYLPYGGAFADPVPHLTIGDRAPLADLRAAADAVLPQLPISTSVTTVQVICGSRSPDSWRMVAELPLGAATPRE
ncbi:MAG: 2'-5' RNA ligase family protein [Mycobacteriales bacterium]